MIGCLCVHGFTGGPFELEPLVAYLMERTDWKFSVPTLPGHGESLRLKGVNYKEWIEHAEEALKRLLEECEVVYVIGFSMGGIISSYLATKYPVDKLVLLSAAAYYMNPKQLALDVGEMVRDTFRRSLHKNELFLRYKRKIKETPITATIQFRTLVSKIRPIIRNVTIPTLIVQGKMDGVVPIKSAHFLYDKIQAPKKKLILFEKSKHLLCHGEETEELFEEVYKFLAAVD